MRVYFLVEEAIMNRHASQVVGINGWVNVDKWLRAWVIRGDYVPLLRRNVRLRLGAD